MLALTPRRGDAPSSATLPPAPPGDGPATTLLSVAVPDAGPWFHVGGALTGRGAPDVAALDAISLMPSYAWERLPVASVGGRAFRASIYAKLPVLVAEQGGGAVAVSFPTAVVGADGRVAPTWFSLERRDGALRFDVVVLREWMSLRKPEREFHEWVPGALEPRTVAAPPAPWTAASAVRTWSADTVEAALRAVAEALVPGFPRAADPQEVADRALRFLAAVQDPRSGAFVEWKRRGARGFLRGWFALPTYHRLAGTLAVAAREDPALAAMAERCARPLTLPRACFRDPGGGLVFHNSLCTDRLGRLRFYSHLGSGPAGYPGGQANVLFALATRIAALDPDHVLQDPRTAHGRVAAAEASRLASVGFWLLRHRGQDGRLPRALRLVPEPHDTGLALGPETRSDGGDAEAALALLAGRRIANSPAWTRAAVELLERVDASFAARGHVRGYLRDNREEEPECVSHVAAIRAHLAAHDATGEDRHVESAVRHALHLALWIRPGPVTSLDTLVSSFGPRLAPCESLWAARAYRDLARVTGDALFERCSAACADVLRAEEGHPGWTEAVYLDAEGGLHPHSFECVYSAEAALEWALASGARPRAPRDVPGFHREAPRSVLGRALARARRAR